LLCFLLPFVSVTCSGQRVVTAKGLDFVLGAEVQVDEGLEEAFQDLEDFGGEALPAEADDRIDPNIFAIVAFGAAAIGLLLALVLRDRRRARSAMIASGLVALSLIAFRIDVGGDAEDGGGVVSVDYRIGYWGAIVLALVALLAHGSELWRERRAHSETVV
jgi:hypothetical protein